MGVWVNRPVQSGSIQLGSSAGVLVHLPQCTHARTHACRDSRSHPQPWPSVPPHPPTHPPTHTLRPTHSCLCPAHPHPTLRVMRPMPSTQILAHNAVHAAFAGFTGITVGLVNTHYCYLPIPVVIQAPRKVRGGGWGGRLPPRPPLLCALGCVSSADHLGTIFMLANKPLCSAHLASDALAACRSTHGARHGTAFARPSASQTSSDA